MKMRYIPNILSMVRIPFSIAFPFLAYYLKSPVPFLVAYGIAGAADVLDGFLARKFHWESKLGAKMDSIGDTVFLIFAILTALLTLDFTFKWYVLAALGVLVAVRVTNAIITRVKFKQWGFIHNLFVKYSALPIFFLMPLFIAKRTVYNVPLAAMLVLVILASVEETWILKLMVDYDMNMKSIYHMKKLKKRPAPELDAPEEVPV
ncbi:MAG: CDP-alcohol phosphatidyltransferase family protein [Firmicutes bacterium]|nr:CDP-alcohol phosphatidyltransferase family protein [Bacillota bacterium]